jgi:hypothetical protein
MIWLKLIQQKQKNGMFGDSFPAAKHTILFIAGLW